MTGSAPRRRTAFSDTDPNSIDFVVTGVYQFRIGVKRSGTTDTLTSADLAFRKDGVSV